MPSVATRRRRANNIHDRMEGQTLNYVSPTLSSSSSSSIADIVTPLLSFVEPSPLNLTLFPLLLLSAYLYLHRAHLSLLVTGAMFVATAAYLLGFVSLLHSQLQSKQSQPILSHPLSIACCCIDSTVHRITLSCLPRLLC